MSGFDSESDFDSNSDTEHDKATPTASTPSLSIETWEHKTIQEVLRLCHDYKYQSRINHVHLMDKDFFLILFKYHANRWWTCSILVAWNLRSRTAIWSVLEVDSVFFTLCHYHLLSFACQQNIWSLWSLVIPSFTTESPVNHHSASPSMTLIFPYMRLVLLSVYRKKNHLNNVIDV